MSDDLRTPDEDDPTTAERTVARVAAKGPFELTVPHAALHPTLPASPRASGAARQAPEAPRFLEQRELGRGGMGRVCLARDGVLAREVAIKQALSDEPGFLARFSREVRLTARLEHPSIVPVHDAGLDSAGRPYYVMRRIEGEPLDAVVRRQPNAAARLALVPHVLAAADAAAYAHAQGILHRDIKPTNILVGRYGETWLIDWGLARDLAEAPEVALPGSATAAPSDSGLTRAGEVMGTPGFVAPEQARGEIVGVSADVYSLGATLAYVLTGRLVYPERAATGLLQRAAANAPIQLGVLEPEIPPALLAIVEAATAARVEDRYASAEELATELRRFLTGQLVAAHRYSRRERLRRFARRHRGALAIGAIATIALATVATASIAQIIDERDRATAAERAATTQQRLAEQRAEQLMVERARVSSTSDPAGALATLSLLPAQSPRWEEAWGIAVKAQAAGPSLRLAPHRETVFAMEMSPDGGRLATGGNDGVVMVHELSTLAAKVVAREGSRITALTWLDDGWLAYSTGEALVTVDLAGVKEHRLPAAVATPHRARHGARLRFVSEGRLYEIDRDLGAPPSVLAATARDAVGAQTGTLVSTGAELTWVDATGQLHALGPYIEPYLIAAASPDGRRVAVSSMSEVRELDVTTGKPLRTWPLRKVTGVEWDSGGLCLTTFRESWIVADEGSLVREISHVGQVRFVAARPQGCVFAEQSGATILADAYRQQKVTARDLSVRRGAASRTGYAFALSSEGGGVELWPQSSMPRLLSLEPLLAQTGGVNLIALSDEALYFHDHQRLHQMSRATGEVSRLPELQLSTQLYLVEAGPELLVVFDPVLHKLAVMLRKAQQAAGDRLPVVLHKVDLAVALGDDDDAWIFSRGAELRRFDPHTRRETFVTKLDGDAVWLATNGGYVLAMTKTTAHRVKLGVDEHVRLPLTGVRAIAIEPSGTAWFAAEGGGVRWDGKSRSAARALDEEVTALLHHRALGMVARTRAELRVLDAQGASRRVVALPPTAGLSHVVPAAYWLDGVGENLVVADLLGGERVALPLAMRPSLGFAIDDDGAIAVISLVQRLAMILAPPPPHEPFALRAWLRAATNAPPPAAAAREAAP